ncbi:MAG: hypothetical protein IJ778_00270 [Alphaproteobacteria bacterium]|nr:hypothetical protein [Alphaproteobacteria bacterium]
MNFIWQQRLAQSRDRIAERNKKRETVKWRIIKCVCAVLILCQLYPQYWKRLIYPYIYGTPTDKTLTISDADFFKDVPPNTPPFVLQRNNINYLLHPRAQYSVTGKIGYVDIYDGWWNRFYRSSSQKNYINIVPLDLFIVIGNMAKPEIYQMFRFTHEERAGSVLCKGVKYKTSFFNFWLSAKEAKKSDENFQKCGKYIRSEELNNYHPIPANEKINKALHMLLPEDIIYIEGYLVDVLSMGLKTGTRKQQQHDYLISGYNPGMCFVLYTTKIIFNGRIYQ